MRAWVVCILAAGCVAPTASLDEAPAPAPYRWYDVTEPGIGLPVVLLGFPDASAGAATDALAAWGWSGPFTVRDVCTDCPDLETGAVALAHALAGAYPGTCMTAVAVGDAGLALRWMLARVEEHAAAYPLELCVKVAATVATPHDCTRCPAPERRWLAENATRPLGSGGTDWYVFGNATGQLDLDAVHAVRYLGGDLMRADAGLDAHVRYAGVESRAAPWPVHWVHLALTTTHTRWASPHVNEGPVTTGQQPAAGAYSIAYDGAFTASAVCLEDIEGDPLQIVFRAGGQTVQTRPVEPGERAAYTFRFSEAGTWLLQAVCMDGAGAAKEPASWSVTSRPRPTDPAPNIERVAPPGGTYDVTDGFAVEVECSDAQGPAEVRFEANGTLLALVEDAAGMSPTHTFRGNGTVHAAALCVDEHGRYGPSGRVDWTLHFT